MFRRENDSGNCRDPEMENMISFFETEHFLVRKMEPEDTARLFKNHAEEKVKKWFPNESYADLSEAEEAVRFFRDCVENKRLPFVLAVQLKETGELIGDTGISEVEGQPEAVEVGYQICEKYSGRGFATEVLKAMTEFAFCRFGSKISYGRVVHGNAASARVLEKAGYLFVDEEFGAEDDPYGNGMLVYKREAVHMMLRPYRKEDAEQICSWLKTEEEMYKWSADRFNKFPLSAGDMENNYAPQIRTGRFFPLSFTDDEGSLRGHFIIRYPKEDDDTCVRFGFVIVDPQLRGQGFGKKMLQLGIGYVKQNLNARRIDLGVFANNDSARHCYEAVGFREYGRRKCELPVGVWECIDMEKWDEA